MKNFIITTVLILVFTSNYAQQPRIEQLQKKALQAYVKSSIHMWEQLADQADKILDAKNVSEEADLCAIKIKYGLLYSCLANKEKESYENHIDNIEQQLEELQEKHPNSSVLLTLSSAIMSVEMGFSPMKGMYLGSLSSQHAEKAIELDSLNALAWRQYASNKYFTPKMWGGDIHKAIESYELALLLYEKNNQTNDWTYLDTITWLGIAYQKTGDKVKAKEMFEKILQIAPDYSWVRDKLLPDLMNY